MSLDSFLLPIALGPFRTDIQSHKQGSEQGKGLRVRLCGQIGTPEKYETLWNGKFQSSLGFGVYSTLRSESWMLSTPKLHKEAILYLDISVRDPKCALFTIIN
jgi:hypothetical protein